MKNNALMTKIAVLVGGGTGALIGRYTTSKREKGEKEGDYRERKNKRTAKGALIGAAAETGLGVGAMVLSHHLAQKTMKGMMASHHSQTPHGYRHHY